MSEEEPLPASARRSSTISSASRSPILQRVVRSHRRTTADPQSRYPCGAAEPTVALSLATHDSSNNDWVGDDDPAAHMELLTDNATSITKYAGVPAGGKSNSVEAGHDGDEEPVSCAPLTMGTSSVESRNDASSLIQRLQDHLGQSRLQYRQAILLAISTLLARHPSDPQLLSIHGQLSSTEESASDVWGMAKLLLSTQEATKSGENAGKHKGVRRSQTRLDMQISRLDELLAMTAESYEKHVREESKQYLMTGGRSGWPKPLVLREEHGLTLCDRAEPGDRWTNSTPNRDSDPYASDEGGVAADPKYDSQSKQVGAESITYDVPLHHRVVEVEGEIQVSDREFAELKSGWQKRKDEPRQSSEREPQKQETCDETSKESRR
jgi:hypothetical protein